jgi:polysaccharide export outer membrane protein
VLKKQLVAIVGLLSLLNITFLSGCVGPRYPYAPTATYELRTSWKYKIGPGDSVGIFVWRYPEVSTTVPVRPDGFLNAPLIEDVLAAGKTPSELARNLEEKLAVYLRDPLVTVVVKQFVGVYPEQIRVVGAGLGGGNNNDSGNGNDSPTLSALAVPYTDGMTLLDLMIKVGGISDFAAGNRAVLTRFEEGVQKQYTVRLDDLLRDADLTANTDMRPGDILIIPEAWF